MARYKKTPKDDPSYRKLKADYYPVQRQVNLTSATGGTIHVLDVGRNLSRVNHRLYRQGKTYQVKIDLDNRPNSAVGPAQVEVYALADTWYVQKAWQLARATYLTATAEERSVMSKQQIARWEDFRVASGLTGAIDVNPYQYSRADLAGAAQTNGESLLSLVTRADGTQYSFGWNSGASTYNMLDQYAKTGDTDAAPSTIDADKAYDGVEDGVDESQMDNLADRGNLPPYDATGFTGSPWVKIATLDNSGQGNPASATGHSRMSTGFFNAPCGLVVLKPSISHTFAGEVSMTVKSGDYKGVAAMNMGA
jgi:hypothetical protein